MAEMLGNKTCLLIQPHSPRSEQNVGSAPPIQDPNTPFSKINVEKQWAQWHRDGGLQGMGVPIQAPDEKVLYSAGSSHRTLQGLPMPSSCSCPWLHHSNTSPTFANGLALSPLQRECKEVQGVLKDCFYCTLKLTRKFRFSIFPSWSHTGPPLIISPQRGAFIQPVTLHWHIITTYSLWSDLLLVLHSQWVWTCSHHEYHRVFSLIPKSSIFCLFLPPSLLISGNHWWFHCSPLLCQVLILDSHGLGYCLLSCSSEQASSLHGFSADSSLIFRTKLSSWNPAE